MLSYSIATLDDYGSPSMEIESHNLGKSPASWKYSVEREKQRKCNPSYPLASYVKSCSSVTGL